MRLQCLSCGATCSVSGYIDYDTNALELNEDTEWNWEGTMTECEHEDFEVVDSEYDERFQDDVI